MRILNGYAGIGGNRKLWGNDHDVTAVDSFDEVAEVYAKNYPNDRVIVADARQYILDHYQEFDFIWLSPPCQSHSSMMKATRHKKRRYPDLSLYEYIIFLKEFHKGHWSVENVVPYYDPLIKPTARIGRHLFWTSFPFTEYFNAPEYPAIIEQGSVEASKKLKDWLGIHYDGNIYYKNNHCPCQVLRNCVHPKLGEFVFNQMLKTKQSQLF